MNLLLVLAKLKHFIDFNKRTQVKIAFAHTILNWSEQTNLEEEVTAKILKKLLVTTVRGFDYINFTNFV